MKNYIAINLLFCLFMSCVLAENNLDADLREFLDSLKSTDALISCLYKEECKVKLESLESEDKKVYYKHLLNAKSQINFGGTGGYILLPISLIGLIGSVAVAYGDFVGGTITKKLEHLTCICGCLVGVLKGVQDCIIDPIIYQKIEQEIEKIEKSEK